MAPLMARPSKPEVLATNQKRGWLAKTSNTNKCAKKSSAIFFLFPTYLENITLAASEIFYRLLPFSIFPPQNKEVFFIKSSAYFWGLGASVSSNYPYYFLIKFRDFSLLNHPSTIQIFSAISIKIFEVFSH